METFRVLVLSGGGGRGAFHAGVYKYLMNAAKAGTDSDHQGVWEPNMVVGTSIGAVNGAAIVQGMPAEELEHIWLTLEEHDIQGLPPGMRGVARWISRRIFADIMDSRLPQVPLQDATSPIPKDYWSPLPLLPRWLSERLVGRWINLLDTGPLRKTLYTKFGFDEQKLSKSDKVLVIAATNVQTGERMMFSNRSVHRRDTGELRRDVTTGITADRVLASCSIPLVYPWTFDKNTNAYYWDGAVVANTPLGPMDVMRDIPVNVPAEVVIVLMTPWWQDPDEAPGNARRLPDSFGGAIAWTLEWALLASFRERLRLIETYNRFAERERAEKRKPYRYRLVNAVIVAPDDFLPATRILHYGGGASKELVDAGSVAAERAFRKHFPG